jgi:hypothetical protein
LNLFIFSLLELIFDLLLLLYLFRRYDLNFEVSLILHFLRSYLLGGLKNGPLIFE